MYCRHPLKDLRAALCERGCLLPALRNPDTLCFTEQLLAVFLVIYVSKSFYTGEMKKMKEHEKSTSNAVFIRCLKKYNLAPNQKLNLDAALTLYLLCTIACKLCYYFQVS